MLVDGWIESREVGKRRSKKVVSVTSIWIVCLTVLLLPVNMSRVGSQVTRKVAQLPTVKLVWFRSSTEIPDLARTFLFLVFFIRISTSHGP